MSDDLHAKLLELNKQQNEIEAMRKAASKDYRDQLKDIRDEIKDTIEAIDARC